MTDPARGERRLDVSALPPPEPMHRILAALDELHPGEFLRVEHRRQPWPLFATLEELEYAYEMYSGAELSSEAGKFVILIWRFDDVTAARAASRARNPG